MSDGSYDDVWAMMTPASQQQWPHQEAFRTFLSRKFSKQDVAYELTGVETSPDGLSARASLSIATPASTLNAGPPVVLVKQGGSWLVDDLGPLGARGPILGNASPADTELKVPIMIYHRFADELPDDFEQRTLTVATADFREQLDLLKRNGYKTITVAELYNSLYYGLPLPGKPIVLVIDDGFEDAYTKALPLLTEFGFGATVAMISRAIDQPEYLTWEEIRGMSSGAVEFISHTANHVNLGGVPPETARAELADSRRTLEEGLGRPVQFLVYPYGEPFVGGTAQARATILRLLPETGYAGALTTSPGPPYLDTQEAAEPYRLHRIPVSGGETLSRFAASIGATP